MKRPLGRSRWILKRRNGDVDWIDLAEDRDRWAVVNAVMNIWAA
jgi:hypothetical protein